VEVVATDGFTGNVVLKVAEGVSEAVLRMVKARLESSVRAKLGAALVKPALMELVQDIHPSEFGGALLVGINGLIMICHGSSDATAMTNAMLACDRFACAGLIDRLTTAMARHQVLWES
jgi:glycerol-3-phosphate acyltransferase PlsX